MVINFYLLAHTNRYFDWNNFPGTTNTKTDSLHQQGYWGNGYPNDSKYSGGGASAKKMGSLDFRLLTFRITIRTLSLLSIMGMEILRTIGLASKKYGLSGIFCASKFRVRKTTIQAIYDGEAVLLRQLHQLLSGSTGPSGGGALRLGS